MPRKPRQSRIATCPVCREQFYQASRKRVFCSDACQQKAYRARLKTNTTPTHEAIEKRR